MQRDHHRIKPIINYAHLYLIILRFEQEQLFLNW